MSTIFKLCDAFSSYEEIIRKKKEFEDEQMATFWTRRST